MCCFILGWGLWWCRVAPGCAPPRAPGRPCPATAGSPCPAGHPAVLGSVHKRRAICHQAQHAAALTALLDGSHAALGAGRAYLFGERPTEGLPTATAAPLHGHAALALQALHHILAKALLNTCRTAQRQLSAHCHPLLEGFLLPPRHAVLMLQALQHVSPKRSWTPAAQHSLRHWHIATRAR